ncbi:MAG: SDR family NAD(P)-dependent oxidoreductase [Terriglobia bacterium]
MVRGGLELEGRTAVVTGGGNGIGREIARTLAGAGARIISVDVDARANTETVSLIRESGGICQAIEGDVSRAGDVERAFDAAQDLGVLVNNAAAVTGDGRLHELSEENWDRVLDTCLKSVYLCSRAALGRMIPRRSGTIVNISSVNALTGIHFAAYTASKGAILSLTRLLALEYGPSGIRVNAICPGTIMTESSIRHYADRPAEKAGLLELYPGGAFGEPADIAECALYLASDRAKFINGSCVVVDGGMSAVHRIEALRSED